MRVRRIRRAAATLIMICTAATALRAVERRSWPAIDLLREDGRAAVSDRQIRSGAWIVLYVAPECASCEAVLAAADAMQGAHPRARLLVVVAAEPSAMSRAFRRYPHLSDATWLADPTNALARELRLPPAPVVLGLRDRLIEWSVEGVLTETAQLQTIMTSWLSR